MKKSYVLSQLLWDELKRVSKRMAEACDAAQKAMVYYQDNYQEPDVREKWIIAMGDCMHVCEVYGERLRGIINEAVHVAELDLDDYGACCATCGIYFDRGPMAYDDNHDYCPACQPDDAGAEADRRGDERRDVEMERSMEK